MKFIRRAKFSIYNDKWPIKIGAAINLQLICKCVPRKPVAVAFQEQDVKSNFFSLRMWYFAVRFYRDFFTENTE
jgi:hypothetical protein